MGMVATIVVGTLTNIEQDKAVPQVSKAEQMFARLFENMKTRQAPLRVGEVSSRAFATIKVPRRPPASAFFLLGINLGRRVDPPVTGRIRGRPSTNAVRPTGGKGSAGFCIRPFRTGPAGLRWKVPVFTWLAGCIGVFLSASIGCAAPYAIDAACLAFLATRIVAAVSGPTSMTASGKS